MGIIMTGIDHSVAPIDIRTVFSFTKKNMAEALTRLKEVPGIKGCVLISTCNRMELWLSTDDEFSGDPYALICEIKDVSGDYRPYFCSRQEREAVNHLFRLAAGLESRILGEDQIVSQVKDALAFARENYAADHVLETLFRLAVTAAKKVKTAGELSPVDQSVVHTAIRTLKKDGYTFAGKKCLVIGNGVMGKLAATLLQEEGANVTVTVRQYRSGVVEIPKNCARIDYGRRMELFGSCDYVLSATVSPNFTLTKEAVAGCLEKPVVLIDLAVPRDIETEVADLPGVRLYDVDDFREDAVSDTQKKAIADTEVILADQMEEFFDWYECVDVIPRIQTVKERVAVDLELRLTKQVRALPLTEQEKTALKTEIEAAAERSMNKLLFGLRDGVSEATFRECLEGLEKVYGCGQ